MVSLVGMRAFDSSSAILDKSRYIQKDSRSIGIKDLTNTKAPIPYLNRSRTNIVTFLSVSKPLKRNQEEMPSSRTFIDLKSKL